MVQKKKELVMSGVTAALLFGFGSIFAYYLVERDRSIRRQKAAERCERSLFCQLKVIEQGQQDILNRVSRVQLKCDQEQYERQLSQLDQWRVRLAHLLEQTEELRPLTAIVGKNSEPTPGEREMADGLKVKKQEVMSLLEKLLTKVNECEEELKKEAVKRERLAREAREVQSIEVDDDVPQRRSIEEIEIENQVVFETEDMILAETTSIELNED
ncbi:hypothetical protein G6F56_010675 [Rhizopus delemar]|nr:hypothetical protein G6F56_010675 [Rhizopus delemar]